MLAYGSLATPKKPEEEHKIHPGWRPRARLGRQFPSDAPKKGPCARAGVPRGAGLAGGAGAGAWVGAVVCCVGRSLLRCARAAVGAVAPRVASRVAVTSASWRGATRAPSRVDHRAEVDAIGARSAATRGYMGRRGDAPRIAVRGRRAKEAAGHLRDRSLRVRAALRARRRCPRGRHRFCSQLCSGLLCSRAALDPRGGATSGADARGAATLHIAPSSRRARAAIQCHHT